MHSDTRADIFRFVHYRAQDGRWTVYDTLTGYSDQSFSGEAAAISAALAANAKHSAWNVPKRPIGIIDLL